MLDMMEPWKCIEPVEAALKADRPVVCVCPNITQVTYLVSHIKERQLGLCLWRTLEVAHRTWDIRPPAAHPSFRQVPQPPVFLALLPLRLTRYPSHPARLGSFCSQCCKLTAYLTCMTVPWLGRWDTRRFSWSSANPAARLIVSLSPVVSSQRRFEEVQEGLMRASGEEMPVAEEGFEGG